MSKRKQKHVINSRQSLEAYKKFLDVQFELHKFIRVDSNTGKQRTLTQNGSLHLFFEHLADSLNDAGFDFRTFIKEGLPVPFNEALVKEFIWVEIQKAMTGKEHTSDLETHEVGAVYDVLNRHLADKGIYVPWPCKETMNQKG